MTLARINQQWQALPAMRQRALLIGWALLALMLLYLLARPLLGAWQDAREWRWLAQQAQSLPVVVPMTADDWAALGQVSGTVLSEVSAAEQGWQLAGRVTRVEALSALLEQAAAHGWQAATWQVQRGAEGMSFRLSLLPAGEDEG